MLNGVTHTFAAKDSVSQALTGSAIVSAEYRRLRSASRLMPPG